MKKTVKLTVLLLSVLAALSLATCDCGASPSKTEDPTPSLEDFDIGNLSQTEGTVSAVTITPKADKSDGAITIYYEGTSETDYEKSETLPEAAGDYAVTFDVAKASGWKAVEGLSAGTLTISVHVHDWGEWDVTTPATCTEEGEETRACTLESSHEETRPIDALEHDWGAWTVTTPATTTAEGVENRTCTRDSSHKETRSIPSTHVHQWGAWTQATAPTCTAAGVETRTCTLDSSHKETSAGAPIVPTAHNWGAWTQTKAPTATAAGEETRTCTINSSHKETRSIPSTHVHQWGAWSQATAPTCTAAGVETRTCTLDSSHKETRTGAAALGHNYGAWVETTAPTTTTEGVETRTCTRDSSHKQTRSIPKLPNTPDFTSVADLKTWLAGQSANSASTPYTVKLNVSDITGIRDALGNGTGNKYVILDLSGSTITSIPNRTFYGTDSLGTPALVGITLPGGLTSIGENGFSSCDNLASVTLPSSLTSIEINGFVGCTKLASITIPNGVTTIKDGAFANTGLSSVTIPASVSSIEGGAFGSCEKLTTINVDAGNANYNSDGGVLFNNGKTTIVQYPKGKTGAFVMPNSVTSIASKAFNGCTGLSSVTISTSVTTIGNSAFSGCSGLSSITIPSGVTTIEAMAFQSCTGLTSVTIPATVNAIGTYAFTSTSLTSVTFEGTIPSGSFGSSGMSPFPNFLQSAFYATDTANGTPGTYTRSNVGSTTWTKSP